ncbi:sulfurtransferase complex subunit TusC [Thaumasiovibrio subtropicus]|uniref:sulfurtransferase complex subunit TusC n=1 Tax=Thaumasiovibrio subtropicus TaxID=1891207 RepID=UPI000B34E9D2|nr:sulfurtransferase complex subunit TusC [Thaumasiovibrio subtropicus]
MKTLGFIFKSAPHMVNAGREGTDAILATAAYCEQIKVFFLADGVTQSLSGQQTSGIYSRDYSHSFKLFDLYDIEEIYFCELSLKERGLTVADCLIEGDAVSPQVIRQQLADCDQIMVF